MNMEVKKTQQKAKKNKGSPLDGRPLNSKDSKKRKPKRVLPKSKAEFMNLTLWAESAYANVGDTVSKAVLAGLKKKNLRNLTTEESKDLEMLKFNVFAQLEPFSAVSEENVYKILEDGNSLSIKMLSSAQEMKSSFAAQFGREPNFDELRKIYVSSYVLDNLGEDDKT